MPRPKDRKTTAEQHRKALEVLQESPGKKEEELARVVGRRLAGARLAGARTRREGDRVVLEERDLLVGVVPGSEREVKARDALRAAGVTPEVIGPLRGTVWRAELSGVDEKKQKELRKALTKAGVRTSFVQLTPTGVVMKSMVTPVAPPTGVATPVLPEAVDGSVRVVVIDNGVNVEQRGDGWLAGLQDDGNKDPLDEFPVPNQRLDLAAGHGTFVAGLVQQVDPGADLSVVRVLDGDGLADEVQVAIGLVTAVEDGLVQDGGLVVNLSVGADTTDDLPPIALEAAMRIVRDIEADRHGEVLVVAAAGNDGTEVRCWPAAFAEHDPRVVCVAATDIDGNPAGWSSRGSWVTCSTVGEAVLSTFVAGQEDEQWHQHDPDDTGDTFGRDAWAWWTGTSFAAPQVAGAVSARAREDGLGLTAALAAVLQGAPVDPLYGRKLGRLV